MVSDAGTPGISDPGSDLIRAAAEAGLPVTMAPGPVAGIMALVLSGLPTDKFVFEGFIGTENKKRAAFSEMIASETRTVILYEAPHRLLKTLELLAQAAPGRRTAVCRELTKTHEEIRRGTTEEQLEYFTQQEPRGEFVIVIEGVQPGADRTRDTAAEPHPDEIYRAVEELMQGSECKTKKEALKVVAGKFGISKNQAYALYEEGKQSVKN